MSDHARDGSTLLSEVLEAHGGHDRWARARSIRGRVRAGGLLFRTRIPGDRLSDGRIEVTVGDPIAGADPFPRQGCRGVFDHGAVRIENMDGEVLESRERPRELFFGRAGLRRPRRRLLRRLRVVELPERPRTCSRGRM